jgi:hypothetical protein
VLRSVLASAVEGKGWLDLTIVCSRTGRMLPDVRDAVHRLVRRRLLVLDDKAPHTPRWMSSPRPRRRRSILRLSPDARPPSAAGASPPTKGATPKPGARSAPHVGTDSAVTDEAARTPARREIAEVREPTWPD